MARFLRYLLLAVPFLLPTALVRFTLLGLPFSFLEIYVGVVCVLWMLWLLMTQGLEGYFTEVIRPFFRLGSIPQLLLLFFLGGLLTWSVVPSEVIFNTGIKEHLYETYETRRIWLGIMKGWMLPMLLYGVMLHGFIKSREDVRMFLSAAVGGALLLVVLSLVSRYVLGLPDTLDGRFGGLYVSANYLVFLIAPAFVWALTEGVKVLSTKKGIDLTEHRTWGRGHAFLVLSGIVLLGVALLLARSYASWLILAAIFVFLVLYFLRGIKLYIALGLMTLLMFGALTTEVGSEKLQGFFTVDNQSSTSTRVEVYQISWDLLKKHWLLGIGPGQYESQYITNAHEVLGKTPYEWVMLHPHNLYLSIWLSTGLLGAFAFLGMLIQALRGAYSQRSFVVFLPFLYLLLHGIVDTPFWKLDSMLLFVVLLICSAHRPKESQVRFPIANKRV